MLTERMPVGRFDDLKTSVVRNVYGGAFSVRTREVYCSLCKVLYALRVASDDNVFGLLSKALSKSVATS